MKDLKDEYGLYQCPYSKGIRCYLKDPCLTCETFGEYLNGETTSRLEQSEVPEKKEKEYIDKSISIDQYLDLNPHLDPHEQ